MLAGKVSSDGFSSCFSRGWQLIPIRSNRESEGFGKWSISREQQGAVHLVIHMRMWETRNTSSGEEVIVQLLPVNVHEKKLCDQ